MATEYIVANMELQNDDNNNNNNNIENNDDLMVSNTDNWTPVSNYKEKQRLKYQQQQQQYHQNHYKNKMQRSKSINTSIKSKVQQAQPQDNQTTLPLPEVQMRNSQSVDNIKQNNENTNEQLNNSSSKLNPWAKVPEVKPIHISESLTAIVQVVPQILIQQQQPIQATQTSTPNITASNTVNSNLDTCDWPSLSNFNNNNKENIKVSLFFASKESPLLKFNSFFTRNYHNPNPTLQ
jgi:hypothetical protein